MKHYLAFDLGASSGRAILGTLDNGKMTLKELHRFENGGIRTPTGLYWNLIGLFAELKEGLRKALAEGVEISGMAIDTWGVDYILLDEKDEMLGLPRHYRDTRTDDIFDYTLAKVSREEMYAQTGIQFMSLNTIFQLSQLERENSAAMEKAETLLFMPNALTYLFCGSKIAEYSIATTSQAFNPETGDWAWDMIEKLNIPKKIFPEIKPACSKAGTLLPHLQEELKCGPIPVILIGSHDTASAVAAVPAGEKKNWAFLSNGTWSLCGVELDQPILGEKALQADFTNEGGVGNKIRFLKNIMGMWLLQESRAEWKRQGKKFTFDELDRMAMEAEPFRSLVDPNDSLFAAPGDMPARFAQFCEETGQPVPETPGQIIRCALESLALKYRQTIEEAEVASGREVEILHLVGGGCKNLILNQLTADAIGRKVITGPVEATAFGNLIGQAIADGELADLDAAREVVKNSIETIEYLPQSSEDWQKAYERFKKLKRN